MEDQKYTVYLMNTEFVPNFENRGQKKILDENIFYQQFYSYIRNTENVFNER